MDFIACRCDVPVKDEIKVLGAMGTRTLIYFCVKGCLRLHDDQESAVLHQGIALQLFLFSCSLLQAKIGRWTNVRPDHVLSLHNVSDIWHVRLDT